MLLANKPAGLKQHLDFNLWLIYYEPTSRYVENFCFLTGILYFGSSTEYVYRMISQQSEILTNKRSRIMKIVVCVKQVPDTEAKIVIGGDGVSIDPSDVKYVMNPYDEFAVEEALKLKEAAGEGEVILLTLGGEESQPAMRTAMAMGADSGVLLKAENSALADGYAVAKALAEEIKTMDADLILAGKIAIDGYGHQVASMIGEILGLPVLPTAKSLDLADGKVTITRDIEGGKETVTAALPCVVTAEKGLNDPRYPALKGIMQAKRKPLEIKEISLEDQGVEILEMSYPPKKPDGRIVGEGPAAVDELVKLLRDEAQVL
jgi:electron transfer flavoprotein beta subunit